MQEKRKTNKRRINKELNDEVVARIDYQRKKREIPYTKLAELCDVAENTVVNYLTQKTGLTFDFIVQVSKAFEIPISYLVGETDENGIPMKAGGQMDLFVQKIAKLYYQKTPSLQEDIEELNKEIERLKNENTALLRNNNALSEELAALSKQYRKITEEFSTINRSYIKELKKKR